MRQNKKFVSLFFLCMLMTSFIYVQGCGVKKDDCTAPDGSTIEINPSSNTLTVVGGSGVGDDTNFDYTVTVLYPDGTPMPKACLNISGVLAAPRNSTDTGFAYQFYFFPGGTTTPGNIPVDSPFTAQTDDNGQYTFSILITAGTGAFFDENIRARSGTNQASASITLEVQ